VNPAAMWLRSHPAERWGLTLLGLLAAAALLLVASGHLLPSPPSGRAGSPNAVPRPSGVPTAPATASVPAQPVPTAVAGPAAAPTGATLPREGSLPDPASLVQARAVASGFLVAYDSYRATDPPDGLRRRLRPFDTDAFDQQVGRSSGAAYLRQQQADHHQVATARVLSLDPEGFAANGELGFVASVEQDVRSDQGTTSQHWYYEVFLARTPAGWRVDDVEV
jgi:hypothetical protein